MDYLRFTRTMPRATSVKAMTIAQVKASFKKSQPNKTPNSGARNEKLAMSEAG